MILRGRITATFDPDTVTREELGAAMTGARDAAPDLAPADAVDEKEATR